MKYSTAYHYSGRGISRVEIHNSACELYVEYNRQAYKWFAKNCFGRILRDLDVFKPMSQLSVSNHLTWSHDLVRQI